MENARSAVGFSGELLVGYHRAARLTDVRIDVTLKAAVCRGTIVDAHDYWITERPMTLVLNAGVGRWTWKQVEPQISGDAFVAPLVGTPATEGGE